MTARPAFVAIDHDLSRYAFGAGWKDPHTRCVVCHDPCRKGWKLCDRCHALAYPQSPIARAYRARQREREVDASLRRIVRRLVVIENAMRWPLLQRSALDPNWQTR